MKWATRPNCHIDRAACAWLIRRYLDAAAEFIFVDDPEDVPPDATPFDMRGVLLSHHAGRCSFETFLLHYQLDDPALQEIARIVHEVDLADERFDAPEAPGLDVLLQGLALLHDDAEFLALTEPLFDALYAIYERRAQALALAFTR